MKLNGLFNLKSTQGGHQDPANVNIQFVSLVSAPAPMTGDWSRSVCVKIPHFTAVNPILSLLSRVQLPAWVNKGTSYEFPLDQSNRTPGEQDMCITILNVLQIYRWHFNCHFNYEAIDQFRIDLFIIHVLIPNF